MKNNKKRLAGGFSFLAPIYDHLADLVFGNVILESQASLIDRIPPNAKVLILGGGTGRILKKLDDLHIPLKIDYVEISQGMMAKAKLHEFFNLEVNFINEKPSKFRHYDVIFAAFYFDVFTKIELRHEVEEISTLVAENGILLVTDFQVAGDMYSRLWQKAFATLMYIFFFVIAGIKTLRLNDFKKVITQKSFKVIEEKLFFKNFIASRIFSFNPLIES